MGNYARVGSDCLLGKRLKDVDFKSEMAGIVSCQAREYKEWREKMGAKNEDTKPVFLFLIVVVSIFATETLVMFLMPMEHLSLYQKAIADASLLTAMVFPSLYFFLLRPMISDITVKNELTEEIQQRSEKLKRFLEGTVNAVSQITEKNDPGSAGRQRRVSQLSTAIARELGLLEDQTEGIRIAGLFFDIGKVAIPTEILFKPDKMNKYEYDIFKTYPQIGYDILKDIEFPWPVAQIVLQHRERMNGNGYPYGLREKDIILEARVVAVAEVVESMSCSQLYQPALGVDRH